MNDQLLDRFTIMAQTGNGRQIRRSIPFGLLTLFVGYTDPGRVGMSFIDADEQIIWGIIGGYPYPYHSPLL
ncbi:hypothetical protein ACIBCD_42610 [Nocardia brasiliensis]|uniref:hypothetical protein n=1 Tax=Nocardia brasiliensis TaxID=37326 RepID=UPI0037987C12